MVRKAGVRGDIDQPGDAQGAVGGEAQHRPAGSLRARLQEVVDRHQRLAEIDDHIVQPLADRPRGEDVIELADRGEQHLGQHRGDREADAVQLLEWVLARGRRGDRRVENGEAGERAEQTSP